MAKLVAIVEDNVTLASSMRQGLQKYGYDVWVAEEFQQIAQDIVAVDPDLVLLDINLPNFDGYHWCREIRKQSRVPIIIVSSRDSKMDQILGIEFGADDYILKPFDMEILLSKIQGLMRRVYGELAMKDLELEVNQVMLNKEALQLHYGELIADLTVVECRVFQTLMERFPEAARREELMIAVWDDDTLIEENTLNVNMKRCRDVLKTCQLPLQIKTIRSYGYRLECL